MSVCGQLNATKTWKVDVITQERIQRRRMLTWLQLVSVFLTCLTATFRRFFSWFARVSSSCSESLRVTYILNVLPANTSPAPKNGILSIFNGLSAGNQLQLQDAHTLTVMVTQLKWLHAGRGSAAAVERRWKSLRPYLDSAWSWLSREQERTGWTAVWLRNRQNRGTDWDVNQAVS